MRRIQALYLIIVTPIFLAGCVDVELQRVNADLPTADRIRAINRVAPHNDPRVVDALVIAAADPSPGIRWYAARGFGECPDSIGNLAAYRALVKLLADTECGQYCEELCGGQTGCFRPGPIRAEALQSLTRTSGGDCGFDTAAWSRYLNIDPP